MTFTSVYHVFSLVTLIQFRFLHMKIVHLSSIKNAELGNFSGFVAGFVGQAHIIHGMAVRRTSLIVSDSLPISSHPRSLRYNYYIYGSGVLTVSYLTDISVYNSKIIAIHNRSSIQNKNITSGCVDLPFEFDVKVKKNEV